MARTIPAGSKMSGSRGREPIAEPAVDAVDEHQRQAHDHRRDEEGKSISASSTARPRTCGARARSRHHPEDGVQRDCDSAISSDSDRALIAAGVVIQSHAVRSRARRSSRGPRPRAGSATPPGTGSPRAQRESGPAASAQLDPPSTRRNSTSSGSPAGPPTARPRPAWSLARCRRRSRCSRSEPCRRSAPAIRTRPRRGRRPGRRPTGSPDAAPRWTIRRKITPLLAPREAAASSTSRSSSSSTGCTERTTNGSVTNISATSTIARVNARWMPNGLSGP